MMYVGMLGGRIGIGADARGVIVVGSQQPRAQQRTRVKQ